MQKLLLTGSDVFFALNEMRTDDLGKTWSGPREHAETLGRRNEPDGVIVATCDFTPKWHARSGKLLGTGQTVRYRDDKVIENRDRETSYSVYDPAGRTWTPWATLEMPDPVKFQSAGAGSVQRLDLPDGDILLPIYFKSKEQKTYRTTVVRCAFDGTKLAYREHGSELTVDDGRGLYEPSLTRFGGRYLPDAAQRQRGLRRDERRRPALRRAAEVALGRRHGPRQLQHAAALGDAQRAGCSSSIPARARTTTTSSATAPRCSSRRSIRRSCA